MMTIMPFVGLALPAFALYLALRLVTAIEDIAATYRKSVEAKGRL
jgi:hypothetical protein